MIRIIVTVNLVINGTMLAKFMHNALIASIIFLLLISILLPIFSRSTADSSGKVFFIPVPRQ